MKIDNILNDGERNQLASFCSNENMREAVKKVLLFGIYNNGTLLKGDTADSTQNWALSLSMGRGDVSNEILGQDLRACTEGIRMLENAFKFIETYQEQKDIDKIKNPGR